MKHLRLAGVAAVLLSTLIFGVQAQEKPLASTEKAYQVSDSSPVGNVPLVHSLNPKAPI